MSAIVMSATQNYVLTDGLFRNGHAQMISRSKQKLRIAYAMPYRRKIEGDGTKYPANGRIDAYGKLRRGLEGYINW